MLTPEMIEFAKTFGFPALLVLAGGFGVYTLILKPLMSTHMDYVKESKEAITEVAVGMRDANNALAANLESSRRIEGNQAQHTQHLVDIKSGIGCKAKA